MPKMSDRLPRLALAGAVLAAAAAGCEREARRFHETPPGATAEGFVTLNDQVQPGPMIVDPEMRHPYERNAWAVSEGQNLYSQMNCAGCHSPGGGGGMGPSLIDSVWIYGAEPENIFQTIVQGRPNGMPAFRGRIGNADVWKLVAYIRAMNGQTPQDTRAGRTDGMHEVGPDVQLEPNPPQDQRVPKEEQAP